MALTTKKSNQFRHDLISHKNPYFRMKVQVGQDDSSNSYNAVGLMDTGATYSVLSHNSCILLDKKMKIYPINTTINLQNCSGQAVDILGETTLNILDYEGRKLTAVFYVV